GGKGLGAHLVLPVKQVAARLNFFNRAFILRGQPLDAVANHGLAFLATRVADETFAGWRFNEHMAAKPGHHQTRLGARDLHGPSPSRFAQASKASTFDAQKKSLTEMPFTSCELKRTVDRP